MKTPHPDSSDPHAEVFGPASPSSSTCLGSAVVLWHALVGTNSSSPLWASCSVAAVLECGLQLPCWHAEEGCVCRGRTRTARGRTDTSVCSSFLHCMEGEFAGGEAACPPDLVDTVSLSCGVCGCRGEGGAILQERVGVLFSEGVCGAGRDCAGCNTSPHTNIGGEIWK